MKYGTVFLLEEDFSSEHIRKNFEKMKKTGFNTVVIWPAVFYRKKKYFFDIHHIMFEQAEKNCLDVIIELTGQIPNLEYLPDYLDYRKYMVQDENRNPVSAQNGLGEANLNHPYVQKKLFKYIKKIVKTYRGYKALAGWDTWNETHFKSFDIYTLKAFRSWLKKKYGKIERLNTAWSRTYSGYSDITFDKVLWASIVPDTDWESFRKENCASFSAAMTDLIHKIDPAQRTIVDNVMSNTVWCELDRGTDDWKTARTADAYGISFYPKTGGRLLKENEPWLRSLTFTGACAAGRGKFLVSEMQSHYYSDIFTAERVLPDELLTWCFEAAAHGAAGIVFWKWAPFRRGMQIGGRGLVLSDGGDSRRLSAAADFGKFITQLDGDLSWQSEIAVLYDSKNIETIKAVNNRLLHIIGFEQYHKALFGFYQAAFRHNIPVKILIPEELEACTAKILILPWQIYCSEVTLNKIRIFTEKGGICLASRPFADICEHGTLYKDIPGGPLNTWLGITHYDIQILENACFPLGKEKQIKIEKMEIQEIKIHDKSLETAASIDNLPLILRKKIKNGCFYYLTSELWNYSLNESRLGDALIAEIIMKHLRPQILSVKNCSCRMADDSSSQFLFIFNNSKGACEVQIAGRSSAWKHVFGSGMVSCKNSRFIIKGQSPVYIFSRPKNENT
ncbi:MAG TPA: hypothetical protein DC049_17045 [Spirochaetia bacterium]|nr:hypothetical protein [Spirochaetia bacterium]